MVNLAAQAGVRYSIQHPDQYIQSNLVGFANVIELSRIHEVENFVCSSSSVYGGNNLFFMNQSVNHPISLYAATKNLIHSSLL